jgi:polyferredoxin
MDGWMNSGRSTSCRFKNGDNCLLCLRCLSCPPARMSTAFFGRRKTAEREKKRKIEHRGREKKDECQGREGGGGGGIGGGEEEGEEEEDKVSSFPLDFFYPEPPPQHVIIKGVVNRVYFLLNCPRRELWKFGTPPPSACNCGGSK